MKLHFLGTGSGMPSKQRNVSALAVTLFKETWLIDCGEATQHQILYTSIKPRKVSAVWITHLHGDHIFGLPGFLSSRSALDGQEPLTLYGPKGIKKWLDMTFQISGSHLSYELKVVEYEDGDTFEQDGHVVTVRKLEHRFPSYGFRIEAPSRPGTLLVDKVRALGVPSGPLYKKIKEADVFEFEGKTYSSKEYVTEPVPGPIVAVLGDTVPCPNAFELANQANVLVHEATFMQQEAKLARQYGHSTTVEAASIARQSNVACLFVTHISARYQGKEAEFEAELKDVFSNSQVAVDFLEFTVGD
jgi:ribonuclease Z